MYLDKGGTLVQNLHLPPPDTPPPPRVPATPLGSPLSGEGAVL